MTKVFKAAIVFTLVLAIVAGAVLSTGCGEKRAKLEMPTIELYSFQKGSTVDFDDATINNAAAGGEAGFKFGIFKAIYPTLWNANKETVANQLFPAPYWKGDGVTTKYAMLASGDQQAVDGTILATKLSQAEQDIVTNAISGFFKLYDEEIGAAKPLEQNTAYGILYYKVSDDAAKAWKADAEAWMTALNAYAAANYGGKTYAQLTFIERKTVEGIVFAKGHGTINPEYSFWRAMTKNSFRNGVASGMNAGLRDSIATTQYGKAYSELDCIQKPTVDAYVWASLDDAGQAAVNGAVSGMLTSQAALDGALAAVSAGAVAGFDAEVAGGTNMELAFYKWLAFESFRNGTTASFYPTQVADNVTAMYPGKTYGTLNSCEQMAVNAAVWAGLGAAERGYGTNAVNGMWGLVQAEMTDACAMDQTTLAMTLRSGTGTETSVTNWKKDVEAGLPVKTAFYRWLAKEALIALKGMGTLIRLSVAEFLFKIENPNKYAISLDTAEFNWQVVSTAVTAAGDKVDTAKVVTSDKVWIPGESEVLLKVAAPIKQMDIITWAVLAGKPSATAQRLAADVWSQYQAGTQEWIITVQTTVSDDKGNETLTGTYNL